MKKISVKFKINNLIMSIIFKFMQPPSIDVIFFLQF